MNMEFIDYFDSLLDFQDLEDLKAALNEPLPPEIFEEFKDQNPEDLNKIAQSLLIERINTMEEI